MNGQNTDELRDAFNEAFPGNRDPMRWFAFQAGWSARERKETPGPSPTAPVGPSNGTA